MSETLLPPPEAMGHDHEPEGKTPEELDKTDLSDKPTEPGEEATLTADAQDSSNSIEAAPDTVPYQSDEAASAFMQEQREALGLESTKEDDPRWQAAYRDAYVQPEPVANYGDDKLYGDLHDQEQRRYDIEAKRNDTAARQAADAALRESAPEAYGGYQRYAEYETPILDPAFYQTFPPAEHNRDIEVKKIDDWIAEHPEKAFQYRAVLEEMRDDAVKGAADRGEPIPAADEQRLLAIRATGKKISSLPFYDRYGTFDLLHDPTIVDRKDRATTSAHETASEDNHTQHHELDRFGALVQNNPNLYELVSTAENPEEALSFAHEAMSEYTALLDADTINARSAGLALKNQLETQRTAALHTNERAEAYKIGLRLAVIDALLQERLGAAKQQDVTLAA